MLNIGRIGAGTGIEYLTGAVATGMHDYYTGAGEAPGQWWGAGAEELGLSGEAATEEVEALFGLGEHPGTGEALGARYRLFRPPEERAAAKIDAAGWAAGSPEAAAIVAEEARRGTRTAVAGLDLTFRPVKSVSALWAVAPPAVQAEIVAAHDDAVTGALDHLQDHVAGTRAGRDGVRHLDVEGVTVARYRHRTSRNGDPLLHTHCAVANKVRTAEDGKWRAIDGARIFEATPQLNAIYTVGLEAELTRRLGVEWVPRADGRGRELACVAPEVIDRWSTRRHEIVARYQDLADDVRTSGRSITRRTRDRLMQQATLETRAAKAGGHEDLHTRWAAELRGAGAPDPAVAAGLDASIPARSGEPTGAPIDPVDIGGRAVAMLQAERATWTRTQLVGAVAHVAPGPLGPTRHAAKEVAESIADQALGRGEVIVLPVAAPIVGGPVRDEGASVYDATTATRATTTAILAAEATVLGAGERTGGRTVGAELVATVAADHGLGSDQIAAAARLLLDGRAVDVMVGPAGAGKTRTVGAVADAWTRSGGRVMGTAVSETATRVLGAELAAATGGNAVEVANLTVLLARIQRDPAALRGGDLVVVDEAGMAPTLGLAALVGRAEAAGARVICVGDHRQLGAVEAGGLLRQMVAEHGAAQLTGIHRFHAAWERDASTRLRDGDTAVVDDYRAHGRVHGGDAEEVAEAAYQGWAADTAAGLDSVLVAATNDQATDLAGRARTDLIARGLVDRSRVVNLRDGNRASVGDQIVTRRNDRTIPVGRDRFVTNRDRWMVEGVGEDGSLGAVHRDQGQRVTLPAGYVAAHVELAYAGTVHSVQGRTTDTAHAVLSAADSSMETAYVAMTRGREANHAYVACVAVEGDHGGGADTPEAVLAGIVARTGVERTASELVAGGAADSLAHLVPAADDLRDQAQAERARRRLAAVGRGDLDVVDLHGLDRILSVPGRDPMGDLVALVEDLPPGSTWTPEAMAADGAGMRGRATRAPGPADPGPDPGHQHGLDQLARRITARREHVAGDAVTRRPPWTADIAGRPGTPRWDDAVGAVAVYRDRYQVTGDRAVDARPAGRGPRLDAWAHVRRRLLAERPAAAPVGPAGPTQRPRAGPDM